MKKLITILTTLIIAFIYLQSTSESRAYSINCDYAAYTIERYYGTYYGQTMNEDHLNNIIRSKWINNGFTPLDVFRVIYNNTQTKAKSIKLGKNENNKCVVLFTQPSKNYYVYRGVIQANDKKAKIVIPKDARTDTYGAFMSVLQDDLSLTTYKTKFDIN